MFSAVPGVFTGNWLGRLLYGMTLDYHVICENAKRIYCVSCTLAVVGLGFFLAWWFDSSIIWSLSTGWTGNGLFTVCSAVKDAWALQPPYILFFQHTSAAGCT